MGVPTRRFAGVSTRGQETSRHNQQALAAALIVLGIAGVSASAASREREPRTAQVTVSTAGSACTVQLDSDPPVKTDAQGKALLRDVDPTDHYVHIHCPQRPESGHFISPRAGENVDVKASPPGTQAANSAGAPDTATDPAEAKIKLRDLVRQAVQLRARARFDEAVQQLRQAAGMDPDNSDLHRELGITFLLAKDWKRARTEMLEALRHDPTDADAHNGLGYALEKLGEIQPALQEYRTATHLDPDDPSYRQHYIEAVAKEASERLARERKK